MDPPDGLGSLDRYGRGERDPLTGLYEYYVDLPTEAGPIDEEAEDITWPRLFAHQPELEAAFLHTFGIDLEASWSTRSWRWFTGCVAHLLAVEGPFARLFAPDPK